MSGLKRPGLRHVEQIMISKRYLEGLLHAATGGESFVPATATRLPVNERRPNSDGGSGDTSSL